MSQLVTPLQILAYYGRYYCIICSAECSVPPTPHLLLHLHKQLHMTSETITIITVSMHSECGMVGGTLER